jgi:hypothetical protein
MNMVFSCLLIITVCAILDNRYQVKLSGFLQEWIMGFFEKGVICLPSSRRCLIVHFSKQHSEP